MPCFCHGDKVNGGTCGRLVPPRWGDLGLPTKKLVLQGTCIMAQYTKEHSHASMTPRKAMKWQAATLKQKHYSNRAAEAERQLP